MLKNKLIITGAVLLLFSMLLAFHCDLPQDPSDPSNTSVNMIFQTTDLIKNSLSITDTLGDTIRIGVEVNLPKNVDSLRLTIRADGVLLSDSIFKNYETNALITLWKTICFSTIGTKIVTLTPYSSINIKSVVAVITIIPRSGPANNKPVITVNDAFVTRAAKPCSLKILVSDADLNQKLTVTMAGEKTGATLQGDSLFLWTPAADYVGYDTVTFLVVDDGKPQLSDTAICIITVVSADTVNHAPKWNQDTLPAALNDTALYTLQLSTYCNDPDGDSLTYSVLAGAPAGDTIQGNQYLFKATSAATGKYVAALVATDTKGAKDTLFLSLVVGSSPALTVTYIGNGNTSGSVPVDSGRYMTGVTVTVKANIGILAKSGSTFAGWNTTADGSGMAYAAGATFAMGTVNDTLYARWTTNPTYTVFYNGNGNAGGTVPVDAGSYEAGVTVTVKANTGNLVIPGSTFAGWNTAANGSGTAYAAGATFVMGAANDTLYARWTTNPTYTVIYSGNGNTGGTVPVDVGNYEAGVTVTVKSNTGNLMKPGSTFAGWNTTADGSGTAYAAGALFIMGTANDTLYARWTTNPTSTVVYNGNGDTGGTVPVDAGNYEAGVTVTVKSNIGGLVKTGSTFAGWNNAADGSGTAYAAGAMFLMGSANDTLFAQWTVNLYTVTFDKNDATASGTMIAQSIASGASANLTVNGFVKAGATFAGWATSATGMVEYTNQASYTMSTANVTLFAKWTSNPYTITFDKNDAAASGTMNNQTISSGASANLTANGFSKARATFAGWATSATGLVVYVNLASYTMGTANVILYAKWTIVDFTVTYLGNDQSSGTVPVSTATYKTGDAVTILANPGKLIKVSASFVGWNTLANGNGTTYSCGQTISMGNLDLILYAKYSTTSVMDNDGNIYSTVPIGSQVWMVQNLKTTKYNDGTPIPLVAGNDDWSMLTTPRYCWYGNDEANKNIYGGLYNWYTVNTHKLAPAGWHVASDNEWSTLVGYCVDLAALKLREGSPLWNSYPFPAADSSSINSTGFSALPCGWRDQTGASDLTATIGIWWSTTPYDDNNAVTRLIWYYMPETYSPEYGKVVGASVRCIRDN